MEELHSVQAPEQPGTQAGPQLVNLTRGEDIIVTRTASESTISGRDKDLGEESKSSSSATPQDEEMVAWVGDRPVYTVDYFTMVVTPEYLVLLREEFQIPDDIDLVVPAIFEADDPETQLSLYAAKCQHVSNTDKLFHSLGEVFLCRAPVQYLLETLPDEGNSCNNEVLLLPGLPGDVHCWLP
ncbi:hypothetical protein TIFTF001_031115 [Ficus carica]|uniref:Uncharacterized protein n=1 Tax=Ficus carica TaxID=3494 RepID=A0AA88DUT4_FICCA|nr:hypothetical protein TIFTF001_031115 [Ficus carica]